MKESFQSCFSRVKTKSFSKFSFKKNLTFRNHLHPPLQILIVIFSTSQSTTTTLPKPKINKNKQTNPNTSRKKGSDSYPEFLHTSSVVLCRAGAASPNRYRIRRCCSNPTSSPSPGTRFASPPQFMSQPHHRHPHNTTTSRPSLLHRHGSRAPPRTRIVQVRFGSALVTSSIARPLHIPGRRRPPLD